MAGWTCKAVRDVCQVCGGDSSTCQPQNGSFTAGRARGVGLLGRERASWGENSPASRKTRSPEPGARCLGGGLRTSSVLGPPSGSQPLP